MENEAMDIVVSHDESLDTSIFHQSNEEDSSQTLQEMVSLSICLLHLCRWCRGIGNELSGETPERESPLLTAVNQSGLREPALLQITAPLLLHNCQHQPHTEQQLPQIPLHQYQE